MRTSRAIRPAVFRTAAAFVITTALAAGPLAAAAPAFAADATVASVATADDGTLSVELPDASALWVKVSVRASADPDLAPVWTSDELSYGGGQGWHTDKPVSLPAELAYGDYPVDVDYRLPGGTVQHWSGAEHGASGLLSYRLHTGVASVAYDREYTDFDHRSPVVSGTVTSYDPVTGTTSPARAGTTVKVSWSASVGVDQKSGTATAVSDDTGAFQVAVTPGGSITSGSATVVEPAADTDPDVSTGLPALPAHTTTYRISADGNHASVHKGKTFTVKGSVLKLTDDGWKPFADAPLVTTPQPPDSYRYTTPGLMGTGTSTATGTFSYPVTATKTTYYYSYVQPSGELHHRPDRGLLQGRQADGRRLPPGDGEGQAARVVRDSGADPAVLEERQQRLEDHRLRQGRGPVLQRVLLLAQGIRLHGRLLPRPPRRVGPHAGGDLRQEAAEPRRDAHHRLRHDAQQPCRQRQADRQGHAAVQVGR
jgi:hypothetical protein